MPLLSEWTGQPLDAGLLAQLLEQVHMASHYLGLPSGETLNPADLPAQHYHATEELAVAGSAAVDGDHYSMLSLPHVTALGRRVAALFTREREVGSGE